MSQDPEVKKEMKTVVVTRGGFPIFKRREAGVPDVVVRVAPEAPLKGEPYALPEASAAPLRRKASPGCKRCRGTGISGWRRRGEVAVICACVMRSTDRQYVEAKEQFKTVLEQIDQEISSIKGK